MRKFPKTDTVMLFSFMVFGPVWVASKFVGFVLETGTTEIEGVGSVYTFPLLVAVLGVLAFLRVRS